MLFQIIPDKDTQQAANTVKPWYRDGKILLDQDNNPVNDFVNIPATLSTEFEGQYMVAMCRLDSRIRHGDFRARMPIMMIAKADKSAIPLFTINTISMRMSRFRNQAALISRERRAGSKSLEENLRQLLPRSCFENNSTRGFGRLLTPAEVAAVKSVNKGKFGYRARKEEAADNSSSTAPSRKRTPAMTEGDNNELNPKVHTATFRLPRAQRNHRAELQEPDWPSIIDPTLDMLTLWSSKSSIGNHHPQAQANNHPWRHANDDCFLESDNAYSTDPSQEFALSVSAEISHSTSAIPALGSGKGLTQPHVLDNDDGLMENEHSNSLIGTSATKQLAPQNQYTNDGRISHDLHR